MHNRFCGSADFKGSTGMTDEGSLSLAFLAHLCCCWAVAVKMSLQVVKPLLIEEHHGQ